MKYLACIAALALASPAVAGSHKEAGMDNKMKDMMVAPMMAETVVDVAVGSPDHTVLVDLVIQAGLVDALSAEGPFTVFAPVNDAFAALPAETLEAVMGDPALLNSVLTYHVVPGKVMAADLVDGMSVTTLSGDEIVIDLSMGVNVNDASVVAEDLPAGNGVVHVIDGVLVP